MSQRIHVVMPDELVEKIDAARVQYQSRGEFIRGAVERALEPRPEADRGFDPPTPAEQPDEKFAAARAVEPELHRAAVRAKRSKATVSPPEPVAEPPAASEGPLKGKAGHVTGCTCFQCHLARQGRR